MHVPILFELYSGIAKTRRCFDELLSQFVELWPRRTGLHDGFVWPVMGISLRIMKIHRKKVKPLLSVNSDTKSLEI
jgi:hypothetical protein